MSKENYINAGEQERNMKKAVMLIATFFLMITGVNALFGIWETPLSPVNQITLHSINQSQYGTSITENENVSCEPIHFELPYKQTQQKIYLKLGYFPICDVNQTDYEEFITLYCQDTYVGTYNVTDNCDRSGGGGEYEYQWLALNVNATDGFYQSEGLSSVFSCYFCVNITSDIPRADFWIRTENTGTKIEVVTETQEVFPQLEPVVTLINDVLLFVDSVVYLGLAIVDSYSFLWLMFATILFAIFMFIQLKKKAKQMTK